MQRRQQVLRDAGNIANIGDYAHRRAERPDLPPLPHLLVIIDEFGELLTARPDFIELFLSIGRIGRSIGVHLLLSSQRIESGKLRGLETYLSYRIGLRTFSEEESRTVLDSPDAFRLPALPGFGYLKVDTSVYLRFKGGYVSGPYRGEVAEEETGAGVPPVRPYPVANLAETPGAPAAAEEHPATRTSGPTLLEVMVAGLARHGKRVQTIWLPPLPAVASLDAVCGTVTLTGDGMRLPCRHAPLHVPVGLLDDARYSGRGSGGSTCPRRAATSRSSAVRRRARRRCCARWCCRCPHPLPAEVAVYGLDLVGGGLQVLDALPNVGGVAGRTDRERVRRTVEEVHGMLEHRQEVFPARRRRGGAAPADARRRAGPELPSADVVLVVDGFGAVRGEFEEVDEMVADLRHAAAAGVHLVAGMLRWNDVRIAVQSTFGQRVELRLNDPGTRPSTAYSPRRSGPGCRAARSPTPGCSGGWRCRCWASRPIRPGWARRWSRRCGSPGTRSPGRGRRGCGCCRTGCP